MIAESLPQELAAVAPALWNHLWQSTLFAGLAGLFTLALRRNRARVRCGLWLAAATKFLVPFSLLAALGSRLGWLRPAGIPSPTYFAIERINQPFAQDAAPAFSPVAPHVHLLPVLLSAVWFCGFLAVLFAWCRRWRRISAAVRHAAPLREGREAEALRRLERIAGFGKPIEMRLSRASLEPGIFGIFRPVLLWPAGLSERLGDQQLEAVLAHELEHVRRRDNLAAALSMLVEAVFWFYPLTWWLGARVVAERERACDQEVLRLGNPAEAYAEAVLKVCEFCLASELACVAGIAGADLKRRVAAIMTQHAIRKLDLGRKLALVAAAVLTVGAPVALGFANARQEAVKPKVSLAEIQQQKAMGAKNAPIRIDEYTDFQCPPCRTLYLQTLEPLIQDYVATGRVYLVHHDFPLPLHAYARQAADYADAAAAIGRFAEVEQALYASQAKWAAGGDIAKVLAPVLGESDLSEVKQLAGSKQVESAVASDLALAQQTSVRQTPTMYVSNRGGQPVPILGVIKYSALQAYLNGLLAGRNVAAH